MANFQAHSTAKEEDFVLHRYKDTEMEFVLGMLSEKWGKWEDTILDLTPQLMKTMNEHDELKMLLNRYLRGAKKAAILRSTAENLVAINETTGVPYHIESVAFLPNKTIGISWRSYPASLCSGWKADSSAKDIAVLRQRLQALEMEVLQKAEEARALESALETANREMARVASRVQLAEDNLVAAEIQIKALASELEVERRRADEATEGLERKRKRPEAPPSPQAEQVVQPQKEVVRGVGADMQNEGEQTAAIEPTLLLQQEQIHNVPVVPEHHGQEDNDDIVVLD